MDEEKQIWAIPLLVRNNRRTFLDSVQLPESGRERDENVYETLILDKVKMILIIYLLKKVIIIQALLAINHFGFWMKVHPSIF